MEQRVRAEGVLAVLYQPGVADTYCLTHGASGLSAVNEYRSLVFSLIDLCAHIAMLRNTL